MFYSIELEMKEVLCIKTHSRNHENCYKTEDFLLILSLLCSSWTLQKCTNLHTLLDMKTELRRKRNTSIQCSFDFSSYPTIFGLKRHVLNCNLFGFVISLFFWVNIMFHCKSCFLQLNKSILFLQYIKKLYNYRFKTR